MKCIIYARQSSGGETCSESVELQKERCRELAEKENLRILFEFEDRNTSGKTYPEGAESIACHDLAFQNWFREQTGNKMFRRGFGSAMRHLAETDYILCYDMTRLYRPISGSFLESYVHQLLTEYHVRILTVNNGILDVARFNDSLIAALQNRINHEQISICRKKSMEALARLRNRGYYANGGKAFGLLYKGNFKLEFDPGKTDVVQFIFREIPRGTSYRFIIRELNRRWPQCFKKCCYESTFHHIARNPIYAGYMYNSNGALIRNLQIVGQELLSLETWRNIQRFMDEKKRLFVQSGQQRSHFPFSGLLRDAYTNSKLVVLRNRKQILYIPNIRRLKPDVRTGGNVLFRGLKKDYCGLYEVFLPLLGFSEDALVNDPSDYEYRLRKFIRGIRVFENRLAVDTEEGEFTLPRYINGNKKHFPLWHTETEANGNQIIVYRYSPGLEGRRLLAVLGNKSIFAEGIGSVDFLNQSSAS